jgi:hypothetical protein
MEDFYMKTILAISLFVLSIAHAESLMRPEICYTTGECQLNHPAQYAPICYKVKTGTGPDGAVTCEVRCPTMVVGYSCNLIPGKVFGVCEMESTSRSDSNTYECGNAIDPNDL